MRLQLCSRFDCEMHFSPDGSGATSATRCPYTNFATHLFFNGAAHGYDHGHARYPWPHGFTINNSRKVASMNHFDKNRDLNSENSRGRGHAGT